MWHRAGTGSERFRSLGSRMRSLLVLRLAFAASATIVGIVQPGGIEPGLVASSAIYAGLEVASEVVRRHGSGRRLTVLGFGVLLDGVFLTWITYLTGGVLSPFQAFDLRDVIAISLLARTARR